MKVQFCDIIYQWTNARLLNIKSNFLFNLPHASEIAVVFANMAMALCTFARSPPGTTVGG